MVLMILLGLQFDHGYFTGALVFLIVGLINGRCAKNYRERVHNRALREIFAGFEGALPNLNMKGNAEIGCSYGYPVFELIFRSEAEMNQAESSGRVARFKNALQQLNRHAGSMKRPFDIGRALHTKWDATKIKYKWEDADQGH